MANGDELLGPDQPQGPTPEELQQQALVNSIDNVPEQSAKFVSPYHQGIDPSVEAYEAEGYHAQPYETWETVDTKLQKDIERAAESKTFTELLSSAWRDGFTDKVIDFAAGVGLFKEFERDEEFNWTEESFADFVTFIPTEYHSRILDAKSLEHAIHLRNETQKEIDNIVTLGKYGASGIIAKFGMTVFDPAFIASMIGTKAAAVKLMGRPLREALKGGAAVKASAKAADDAVRKYGDEVLKGLKGRKKLSQEEAQTLWNNLEIVRMNAHNKAAYDVLSKPHLAENILYSGTALAGGTTAWGLVEDQIDSEDIVDSFIFGSALGALPAAWRAARGGLQNMRKKWNRDGVATARDYSLVRTGGNRSQETGVEFTPPYATRPEQAIPVSRQFYNQKLIEGTHGSFNLPAPNPNVKIPPARVLLTPPPSDAIPLSNTVYLVDGAGNATIASNDVIDPRNVLKSWHFLKSLDPKMSVEKALKRAARSGVSKDEIKALTELDAKVGTFSELSTVQDLINSFSVPLLNIHAVPVKDVKVDIGEKINTANEQLKVWSAREKKHRAESTAEQIRTKSNPSLERAIQQRIKLEDEISSLKTSKKNAEGGVPLSNLKEFNFDINGNTHIKVHVGDETASEFKGLGESLTVYNIEVFNLEGSPLQESFIDYAVMSTINNAVTLGYKSVRFVNHKEFLSRFKESDAITRHLRHEFQGVKFPPSTTLDDKLRSEFLKEIFSLKLPRAIKKYATFNEVFLVRNQSKKNGVSWSVRLDQIDVDRIKESMNMIVSPYKTTRNIYKNEDTKFGFFQEKVASVTPKEYLEDLAYFNDKAYASEERVFLLHVLEDLGITPELGMPMLRSIGNAIGVKGTSKQVLSDKINEVINSELGEIRRWDWLKEVPQNKQGQYQLPARLADVLPELADNPAIELVKPTPVMSPTKAESYVVSLNSTRLAYKEQGKNVDLQVSEVTLAEAQQIIDEGGTLLMTEDGMMGGYIKADGYMGGLFSHPEAGGGATKAFVAQIEKYGGTHAESYATYLEGLYTKLGWKPVSRVKFNEQYAPDGWDEATSILRTKPDVVFYAFIPNKKFKTGGGKMYDEYDDALAVAKKAGDKALASRKPKEEKVEPEPLIPDEPVGEGPTVKPEEGPPEDLDIEQIMLLLDQIPTSGMSELRDLMGIFKSVSHELSNKEALKVLRFLGHYGIQTIIAPEVNGKTVPVNASVQLQADSKSNIDWAIMQPQIQEPFNNWLATNKSNYSGKEITEGKPEDDLWKQVGLMILGDTTIADPKGYLKTIADSITEQNGRLAQEILEAAMSEGLLPTENWLRYEWLTSKAAKGKLDYGPDFAKIFEVAFAQANPDFTPRQVQLIARARVNNLAERHLNPDYTSTGGVGESSLEFFEKQLRTVPNITQEEINEIMKRMGKGEDKPHFLRPRIEIDINASVQLLNRTTGKVDEVFIKDYLNTHALYLTERHTRRVYGLIAYRDLGKEFNKYLGRPADAVPATWDDMKNVLIKEGAVTGKDTKEALELFEHVQRIILGMAIDPPTNKMGEVMQVLQSISLAAFGAGFGVSAIAEAGQAVGLTSFESMMRNIPAFKDIINAVTSNTLPEGLPKELLLFSGFLRPIIGSGRGAQFRELDFVFDNPHDMSSRLETVKRISDTLGTMALKVGGLRAIDAALRYWTATLFTDHLVNSALKGEIGFSEIMLKQMGLTNDEAYRIVQMVKQFGTLTEEAEGVTIGSLNTKEWTDKDMVEKLKNAIHLFTLRSIHQANKGQYSRKFQGQIGRMLFQFRTFMLSAIEGQFATGLQGIAHGDKRAAIAMMTNSFFGGLSYVMSIYARYGFDSDKLEEYLTAEEIMKGMLFRSGWFTIGAPVVDTAMKLTGNGPIFAHGRSTGLASDFFMGSPALAIANSTIGAVRSLIAPVVNPNYQFSTTDWRHWKTIMPLHTLAGVNTMVNSVPDVFDLPKSSKIKDKDE